MLEILNGFPQLRFLKLTRIDIEPREDDPSHSTEGVDAYQQVVLRALEELTLEELELGTQTLGSILDFLSVPNLQLLSCKRVQEFVRSLIIYRTSQFFRAYEFYIWNFCRVIAPVIAMKIGCGNCSRPYQGPRPSISTPHLKILQHLSSDSIRVWDLRTLHLERHEYCCQRCREISLSNFAGDDIVKLVKARRDAAVPHQSSTHRKEVHRVWSRVSSTLGGFA